MKNYKKLNIIFTKIYKIIFWITKNLKLLKNKKLLKNLKKIYNYQIIWTLIIKNKLYKIKTIFPTILKNNKIIKKDLFNAHQQNLLVKKLYQKKKLLIYKKLIKIL